MEGAPNPKEILITPEALVDVAFEHLVEESHIVGTGKDGIVFRVDINDLSDEDRETLIASGFIPQGEERVAAKILKIYNRESGKAEYTMHERARGILEKYGGEGCCVVPTMNALKDQHVTERAQRILNQQGASLNGHAEALIMDFVDGKDLATVMYEFVLKSDGYEDDYIEAMTFDEKEQQVGLLLGFEQPDLSRGGIEDHNMLRALTFSNNEKKLFKYLKQKGFKLDPAVVSAVEKSIQTLHTHGLYHNDLHKRNVMIGNDGRTYLIDFGGADTYKREGCPDDSFAVKQWHQFTLTEAQEKAKTYQDAHGVLLAEIKRLLENPAQRTKLDTFAQDIAARGAVALEVALARARVSDVTFEHFLLSLAVVKEKDEAHRDVVESFIASFADAKRKWRGTEKTILTRFKGLGVLGL